MSKLEKRIANESDFPEMAEEGCDIHVHCEGDENLGDLARIVIGHHYDRILNGTTFKIGMTYDTSPRNMLERFARERHELTVYGPREFSMATATGAGGIVTMPPVPGKRADFYVRRVT